MGPTDRSGTGGCRKTYVRLYRWRNRKIILDKMKNGTIILFVGCVLSFSVLSIPAFGNGPKTLIASWYDGKSLIDEGTWRKTQGVMANGKQYDPGRLSCASWDWPLGTRLIVRAVVSGREVVVINTDRTAKRFAGKRIDLSRGAFLKIGDLATALLKEIEGEEWVRVRKDINLTKQ